MTIKRYNCDNSRAMYEIEDGRFMLADDHADEVERLQAELSELRANGAQVRDQAIAECIACIPGGSYCDPQQIADTLRALQTAPAGADKSEELR